jgi:hypothetical protein
MQVIYSSFVIPLFRVASNFFIGADNFTAETECCPPGCSREIFCRSLTLVVFAFAFTGSGVICVW